MTVRRVVAALAVVAGLLSTSATTLPADAYAQPHFVDVSEGLHLVSPNGDGREDVAVVGFEVVRAAEISVDVEIDYGGRVVVGPVSLGILQPGRHSWTWNGRRDNGKVVATLYTVNITAERNDRTDRDRAAVVLVGKPTTGHFTQARRTVYPRATVVHDRVQIAFLRDEYDEIEETYPGYADYYLPPRLHGLWARLTITDAQGRVVSRQEGRRYVPSFVWDGRVDGKPLRGGKYRAKLVVRNGFGLFSVHRLALRVSGAQLQQQVWTETRPAGDWESYDRVLNPGDLGDFYEIGPDPSTRFPGGLTFASERWETVSFPVWARGRFVANPPFGSAPVDSFRVSASGGPTIEGGPDFAELRIQYPASHRPSSSTTPPGDATTISAWTRVKLTSYPNLPHDDGPASWTVVTYEENSYDVATFTVEYRHYVPVH